MYGVDRNWSLDAHGRSIIAAMSDAPETQVLIAGAGPIGMTAAIELARRGSACRIVDPLVDPPQYAKAVGDRRQDPTMRWCASRCRAAGGTACRCWFPTS